LKTLGRDAQKANKSMLKDLEKLAAAVTPTRSTSTKASRTSSTSRSARSSSSAKKPTASRSRSATKKSA
jgi:hypothetical protein